MRPSELAQSDTTTLVVSPAVQKSIETDKTRDDAYKTSLAFATSIKETNKAAHQDIPLPKIAPGLIASLAPVGNLKAHPLSVRVYGEPSASEELSRSIREIGVVQPIVIDEDNFILAGTSRHFAAVQAGHVEIPAVTFKGSQIEREWLVLESNRQRVKLASQIGREYIERLRLESEFAKLRMVEGGKSGGKNKGTPRLAEAGEARDKAAAAVSLGRTTAERLAKVVSKADAGQPMARKFLAAVDSGEMSITRAFDLVESRKPKAKPVDCPVCSEHFTSMTDLKKHAYNAHKLEPTLLKEAMGFERGEKDPRHNQRSPYDDGRKKEPQDSSTSITTFSDFFVLRRIDGTFFNAITPYAGEVWTGEIDDASRFLDDDSAQEAHGIACRKHGKAKTSASEIKIFKVEAKYRLTETSVNPTSPDDTHDADGTQAGA